jgi:hypothetical protein
MIGEVDVYPGIVTTVVSGSMVRVVKFIFDTGFDGEIAFPQSYATWFGTSRARWISSTPTAI